MGTDVALEERERERREIEREREGERKATYSTQRIIARERRERVRKERGTETG